jgi:MFS family permease
MSFGKDSSMRFSEKLEAIGANRMVLALSVARLGDGIGNSILFIVVPLYVAKLPAPWFPFPETVRVGLLIAIYGLVNAILQPFTGALIDRIGHRKQFIQVGLVIMAVGTLGFTLVARFTDMLVLRSFQGIGVALTVPAALVLMVNASQTQTRGGSMGIYTTSRMLGLGIGPLIGGALYDRFGFNAAFYTGALFIGTAIILVQLWVRDKPDQNHPLARPTKFQIIDRRLLSAGILGAAFATYVMAGGFTMMSTLEEQFNTRLNMTAFLFSIAFSVLLFSRLIFQVPLGRLSDKIGRKPLILAGLILMAPTTALLGYVPSFLSLSAVRFLQGIGSAAVAAPAFAVAGDLAHTGGEGRQMSILTMGFGLGVATGPLLAGILAVHSFQLPFVIVGLLSLVGAWVVYRYVPETIQRGHTMEKPAVEETVSAGKDRKPIQ